MNQMSKKISSLQERAKRWMMEDDNELDQSIAKSFDELSDHEQQDQHPEIFAKRESEIEAQLHDMREQEEQHYLRMHAWTVNRGSKWLDLIYRTLSILVCAFIVVFLLQTVIALPPFGAADAPYNNEVSQRYIESGVEETGAVNFVAGMILDYRAFDTFGESTVLFVAACSVLLLLKLHDHSPDNPSPTMIEAEFDDRHHEPKNDSILQFAARVLVPIILLLGIYIVLNGHISPGGGFSGGAVMGAGLILYLNAFGFKKTERFFTYKTFRWITFVSLMTYGLLKSYSFFMGANHLPSGIPLGTPGAILSAGLILPLNICVGLVVMCTMYAFYTLFRKGGF